MQIEKAWATEQNTTALAVPHMRQRVNVKDMASFARCFFASEACGSAVYEGGALLPANSVIISTANAAIKVLQFVSISQPSLYHL